MYELGIEQLNDLARGAAVLGTGGGGDPRIGRLMVEGALDPGQTLTILEPEDVDDDALVIPVGSMGAPTIFMERVPGGHEPLAALRLLEQHLGREADATMPVECGGLNSMVPLVIAAQTGMPVVDADGMGRAFPELHMETFGVYGVSASPTALVDDRGGEVILNIPDNHLMEWYARGLTIRMGGASHVALWPMSGADVKRTSVPGTLTLGIRVGQTIREARAAHEDPFQALAEMLKDTLYAYGEVVFEGKVVDVLRRNTGGFSRGRTIIEPFEPGPSLELIVQNEHLVARIGGKVRAVVPDLICVLDAATAEPITGEQLRYGQRVRVFAIGTPPIMRTPEALAVFGPAAFGLEDVWEPVETLG